MVHVLGGNNMNNRFQVGLKKINGDLYVRLKGDFNGSTALELINLLGKQYSGRGQVFVDTCGLREICSFGCSTFQHYVHQLRFPLERLTFKGYKASEIAPKGSTILLK